MEREHKVMEEILHKLMNNGIAVVILCIIVYMLFIIGKWLAPRVDKLVTAHVTFVETTGANIVKQTQLIEEITDRQDFHSDLLTETDLTVSKIAEEMGVNLGDEDSDPELIKRRITHILNRRNQRKSKLHPESTKEVK